MKKRIFILIFILILVTSAAWGIYASDSVFSENIGSVSSETKNAVTITSVPSLTYTPTPTETVSVKITSSRLVIPKLGIDSQVEIVGKDEEGRMDVPKNDFNVAWWKLGAKPGETGSAVIAGHYDRKDGGPAVFYDLNTLNKGDEIIVKDTLGEMLSFIVTDVRSYQNETFPLEEVFATTGGKYLNLITCDGVYDKFSDDYSKRLVVYSELQK